MLHTSVRLYRRLYKAQFPFKGNRLRCVRCVNENRKKLKRLRWQAANYGCHCFDRAFLLAGACVYCVKNFTTAVQRHRPLTILFDDRGTCVSATCPESFHESGGLDEGEY